MKNQNVPFRHALKRHVSPPIINSDKLLNSLVDVVCAINEKGVFQYVSESSVHLFGYSPAEMIGHSFREFIHPGDIAKTIEAATDRNGPTQTSRFENRYIQKGGKVIPILWSGRWDEKDALLYCVARDGSEKQNLEHRLLKAQQIARVANFEYDVIKNCYTYTSDTLFEIFGIDKEQHPVFTTDLFWTLVHPDDLAIVKQNTLQPDSSYRAVLEYRIIRPDGRLVYISRIREVVRDKNGMAIKTIGTIQDITDQKINELALRQSEERFRSLVQNSNDLIGIIDSSGTYRFVGANVKEQLGWDAAELIGANAFDFIHPEDTKWVSSAFAQLGGKQTVSLLPFRFQNRHGMWRWMETTISNHLGNPAIKGFVINSKDITERQVQEEDIRRLSLVAKETESAVAITTPDRKTIWVNQAFTRMTGYSLEEVAEKSQAALLEGPATDPNTVQYISEAYRQAKPFHFEILNYKKSGEPFWSEVHIQPLFDREGNITQFFSIRKDITERKKLEKELQEERLKTTAAVIAAQENERAIVSQELHDNVNQVLTTVKLYTEMCRDGIGDIQQITNKSLQLLQASIDEIRSLSKRLSAPSLGKIKLSESVIELVATLQATKKIAIHLDTDRIKGFDICHDIHLAVYRILQEHLTNILKHSAARHVDITLNCENAQVILMVKDDGKGFDASRKTCGMGIANMTTRAESLKGTLRIDSAPGKGCMLFLSIPV